MCATKTGDITGQSFMSYIWFTESYDYRTVIAMERLVVSIQRTIVPTDNLTFYSSADYTPHWNVKTWSSGIKSVSWTLNANRKLKQKRRIRTHAHTPARDSAHTR